MYRSRFISYLTGTMIVAVTMSISTLAVADINISKNVSYGSAGGQELLLDVYSPETSLTTAPAIIFIHGGGWSGGDKSSFTKLATTAATAGVVAFSINYRLTKNGTNLYPAALDDSQRAVRWIRANAAKYNVNPTRIGAIGDSAGGHLVALLGMRDTRDNSDVSLSKFSSKVSCVVDMYGPTDFTLPVSEASPIVLSILKGFLGKTQAEAPELYKDASPITWVSSKAAPFLIMHGTKDPLVPISQSEKLRDALEKAGVEVTYEAMPGDGHGFTIKANLDRFNTLVHDFFMKHLK